ncbi:unnamed protein product [Umbelopsis ramanniana]
MFRLTRSITLVRPLLSKRFHASAYARFPKKETIEHRTRELEQEIRLIEEKLKNEKSVKTTAGDNLTEEELSQIYSELTAASERQSVMQPKISADYIENLRVKFLDTRPAAAKAIAQGSSSETSTSSETSSIIQAATQQDALTGHNEKIMTAKDFDQLLYANAVTKRYNEAEKLLELMPSYGVQPTTRSFNHVIDAYANVNDSENAIKVYKSLREAGAVPDIYTFGGLVKSFVNSNRIDDAFVLFEKMKSAGLVPPEPIFAKLIAGCLRLNNTAKAWEIFDEMQLKYHKPDEVTYTLMMHACAKNDEVERALNLFEEMPNRGLYPTDVTFNTLINACVLRTDYYQEAFNLLNQMQEVHGFEPDRITYNTLLHGCAKNKDLTRARDIYRLMLKKTGEPEAHQQLTPDDRTYSSLLWTYANYRPPKRNADSPVINDDSQHSLVPTDETPLYPQLPVNRRELLAEAQSIFSRAQESTSMTPSILNAYLGVHVAHHQADEVVNIYQGMFEKCNVARNGYTFKHVLDHCYRTKNIELAYKVWDDREEWLDNMRQQYHQDEKDSQAVVKKKQTNQAISQAEHGWTIAEQKAAVLLMANTMSRCNDIDAALNLLRTHFSKGSPLGTVALADLKTTYNKCIQLDDEEGRQMLLDICPQDNSSTAEKTRLLAKKWGTSQNNQRWNSKRR